MKTMTDEEEPPTAAIICEDCGCEVDAEETRWLEGTGDVCDSCFQDAVNTCQLCGDDEVLDRDVSRYIVVKDELAGTSDLLPGIYRISHYPFLSIPMIGSGSIWSNDVLFVACLPEPDHHYEISGHICKKCAWPFSQIYGRVYGRIDEGRGGRYHAKKGYWPVHSAQRIHAKKCFDLNPTRLRDLETDSERDLEILRKKWGIASTQTYHEWLLLKHCGVRIYKTSREDRHGDSWLLLKPEPKYRCLAYGGGWDLREEKGHVMFCASSLPTYTQYDYDAPENQGKYHDYHYWGQRHSLPAIKKAIEQGFIKQEGTFDKDGKPHHYG